MSLKHFLFVILLLPLVSQAQFSDDYDISVSENGIIPMPSGLPSVYSTFVKYTKIQAPNGKAIHFIAQNAISDAQMVRARNILKFYLTNYAGSQYGNDKTAVVNAMGSNGSILMLLNGSDDGNPPEIEAQPLYQNEMAVEGHEWYINNDYEHRDASFEEILHWMHDRGIGVDETDGTPSDIGVLPAYQAEIRAAQDNADNNNFAIWPIGSSATSGWYLELKNENSLSQEYLASVVDSYYGLWEAWNELLEPASATTGMWGLYIAKTREEIQTEDPMGYALMPKYFSPYINVNFDIDPSFSGLFNMTKTASEPYTYKSQYLQHITLTGSNSSSIKANQLDNKLIGNEANNAFEGLKGNDLIDGKLGVDTAIFTGNKNDYIISTKSAYILVKDQVSDRDGVDTLKNCEFLRFADQTVASSSVTSVRKIKKEAYLIYPNPVSMQLVLPFDKPIDRVEIFTYNLKMVKTFDGRRDTVDVSDLESGNYLLKILFENKEAIIKGFVKK